MTDDKKTLKFQMMMSPAEAKELDDWMFANRIRSRAEAIRRLCQIGLFTSSTGGEDAQLLEDFGKKLHEVSLNSLNYIKNNENDNNTKSVHSAQIIDILKEFNKLSLILNRAHALKIVLSSPKYDEMDFEKLTQVTRELLEDDEYLIESLEKTYVTQTKDDEKQQKSE